MWWWRRTGCPGWCPVLWILADIYRGAEPVWSLCWSLLWCYVPSALWGDTVISYLVFVGNELLAVVFASQPQASLFLWYSQNLCVATVRSWAILGLRVLSMECHDLWLRFLYLLACCCHFHSMTSLFPWRVVWGEGPGVGVWKRDPDLTSLFPLFSILFPIITQPRSGELWSVCFL